MAEERIDLSTVGTVAAKLMGRLEAGLEDAREDGDPLPVVRMVGLVVEVDWPPRGDDDFGSTYIAYQCSDTAPWRQAALFREAADVVNSRREPADASD